MKTIKEIADELNITKAGLRKYLTDDIRKQYAETINGVIYITETGENLIKSNFNNKKPQTKQETDSGNESETVSGISDSVSMLVTALQKQLEVKDKQLEAKDSQIEKLTTIIENLAQSINAAQHNALAETIIDTQSIAAPPDEQEGKKRGFWRFWKR